MTSYSFRFPQDTQEGLSLGSIKNDIEHEMLNVLQMKCVMDSIYNIFKDKVKCSIKSMASINVAFNDITMLSLAMLNLEFRYLLDHSC